MSKLTLSFEQSVRREALLEFKGAQPDDDWREFHAPQARELDLLNMVHEVMQDDLNTIKLSWHIVDVQSRRPDLNDEQAREVLKLVERSHDANYGVTWDHIDACAHELYPEPDNIDELREEVQS